MPITREVLVVCRAFWHRPLGRGLRMGIMLLLAIAATWLYLGVLNKSYPVVQWLLWDMVKIWGYVVLLAAACASFGNLVIRCWLGLRRLPTLEAFALGMPVGLVAFCLGMYAGGFLGWYQAWFAMALPIAMLSAGAIASLRSIRRAVIRGRYGPRSEGLTTTLAARVAVGAGTLCLGVLYLQTMTPSAINFDAAWYHLTVAEDYARHGRIIPFADYNRAFPQLTSLVHTWAYLVPGLEVQARWMLMLHNEFAVVVWTLTGVGAGVRWLLAGRRAPGAWAAFFLFPSIFVYDHNLGGAADHFLALFAVPVFLAAARARERFALPRCALTGILVGGAILTKYQAIYLIAAVAVVLATGWIPALLAQVSATGRRVTPLGWRLLLGGPLVLGAVALLISSPHFLKNIAFYSNPFYPFAQGWFTASHPTNPHALYLLDNLYIQREWEPSGDILQKLVGALRLFFTFSFVPHYSFTNGVPSLGSLFTLLLPFAVFVDRPKRLWIGILAGFAALMVWGTTYNVDRYLRAVVPLLAAVTGALVVRIWSTGWLARVGVVPLVALQVVWGADALFYSGHARIESAVTLIRSGYEHRQEQRWGFRETFTDMSEALPADAKVLMHSHRLSLGIDRDVVSDIPGAQGLINYEHVTNARDLAEYYAKLGFTHLVHAPNQRPPPSKQDDIMFLELSNHFAAQRKRFGEFELIWLADKPPASSVYFVLALGARGYQDGLYRIEQMNVYETARVDRPRYPKPTVALGADPTARRGLFEQANAVLVGNAPRDSATEAEILARFSVAARYKGSHTIYLRKQRAP